MPALFPFAGYWWFYLAFTAGVLALLALDLGILHREPHPVGFREASVWAAVWIALALLFNVGFYYYARWAFSHDPRLAAVPGFDADAVAWQVTLEFLTGYVIEKSLSVDNIFVFVLVLRYFGVASEYQHRVLFYGILGAFVFRGIFITLGAVLMQFHWVIWLFGAFLIVTGIKMALSSETAIDPERNIVLRLVRRVVPVTTTFHGPHFFVRQHGRLWGTPLFVALMCLEATDIVFAIDSVPAIFAITREPLIVFTSNIFAILGLRSLYFLLGGAVEKFHLLRYGLAVVLVFVGLKMLILHDLWDGKFPITVSLAFIGTVIAASIVLSLLFPKHPEPEATPGPDTAGPDATVGPENGPTRPTPVRAPGRRAETRPEKV